VAYPRKNVPKDLEEFRLFNCIEACLYVHLHEVQLWSKIVCPVISDILPGGLKRVSYKDPDELVEIKRV
jgi:hypothetical protein